MKTTPAETNLLLFLGRGEIYLRGTQVQTARRLESRGLVVLDDNGGVAMRAPDGSLRSDNERWVAILTEEGERATRELLVRN